MCPLHRVYYGAGYQLSELSLNITMDDIQFLGRDNFFYICIANEWTKKLFALLMWKHVRTANYAPGYYLIMFIINLLQCCI